MATYSFCQPPKRFKLTFFIYFFSFFEEFVVSPYRGIGFFISPYIPRRLCGMEEEALMAY
jgi:hypothetical protein